MGVDYYNILKVNRNASEDDLRRAYKRLVMIWHPDKNSSSKRREAEAKFKQISEAYDVLSDPQKRQIYDLYGEETLKTGMFKPPPPSSSPSFASASTSSSNRHHYQRQHPNPSFRFKPRDAEDIYEEMFGSQSGGGESGNQDTGNFWNNNGFYANGGGGKNVAAIENVLSCSLEELYKGVKRKMRISRNVRDASGR